jgi:hypothetical protein
LSIAVGGAFGEILLALQIMLLFIGTRRIDAGESWIARGSLPSQIHFGDEALRAVDALIGCLVQPDKCLSVVLRDIAAALIVDEPNDHLRIGVAGLGRRRVTREGVVIAVKHQSILTDSQVVGRFKIGLQVASGLRDSGGPGAGRVTGMTGRTVDDGAGVMIAAQRAGVVGGDAVRRVSAADEDVIGGRADYSEVGLNGIAGEPRARSFAAVENPRGVAGAVILTDKKLGWKRGWRGT